MDRAISVAFFDPVARRFPLKASWWLAKAGHEGLKWLMVAFWLLCLAWRPLRLGAAYMARKTMPRMLSCIMSAVMW